MGQGDRWDGVDRYGTGRPLGGCGPVRDRETAGRVWTGTGQVDRWQGVDRYGTGRPLGGCGPLLTTRPLSRLLLNTRIPYHLSEYFVVLILSKSIYRTHTLAMNVNK